MRNIVTITKKELLSYFNSPIAYVFSGVFLILTNWFFFSDFFIRNQATMRGYFNLIPWILLLLVPAITMRLWAEEKRSGTIEPLLTLPITDHEAVIAKFISSVLFLAFVLAFTLSIPITIAKLGSLDKGPVIGGYFGTILLATVYIALGLFISALTKNQIAAFLLSSAGSFLLFILGSDFVLNQVDEPLISIFNFLGLAKHYDNMTRGILDTRNIFYFILSTTFLLFLNVKSLERRDVIRRSKFHLNMALQILIFLGITISANYAATLYILRADLTENKMYSLTKATKNILDSLDDIVTLKAYFSKDLPPRFLNVKQETIDVLKEYETYSSGNIQLKVLDPKEKSEYEDEVRSLGIPILQFSDFEKDKFQISNGYLGLSIIYGDKKETIPVIEDTRNLEQNLTAKIKKVLREKTPTVAFSTGHGELDEESGISFAFRSLNEQYQVRKIDFSTLEEIPDDLDTVIVAGSQSSFSKDELFVLDQFFMQGKSLLFLIDGVQISQNLQATPTEVGLDDLLNHYGVKINKDLILDASNEMESFRTQFTTLITPYPFLVKIRKEGFDQENVIVNRFESLVLPWVSSLEEIENKLEGKEVVKIINTSDKSWQQNEPFNLDPSQNFDIREENLYPKTVAMLINGKFTSLFETEEIPEKFLGKTVAKQTENGRIIIVSDSDFIRDNRVVNSQNNLIFFLNSVDFLTQDPDLIAIRTKASTDRPLKMAISETDRSLYRYLNIFGTTILVILIGIIRATYRKRRKVYLAEKA